MAAWHRNSFANFAVLFICSASIVYLVLTLTSVLQALSRSQKSMLHNGGGFSGANSAQMGANGQIAILKETNTNLVGKILSYLTESRVEQHVAFPSATEDTLHLDEMTSHMEYRAQSGLPEWKTTQERDTFYYAETTGTGRVRGKFVCALESAARLHPKADIYLLMVYSPRVLDLRVNPSLHAVLKNHPNVRVLYVDLGLLLKNSEWQSCHDRGVLNSSTFRAAHTSDIVRFITLYRYGGKYFDLDVILTKDVTKLKRFVIPMTQEAELLGSISGFEKGDPVGKKTLELSCKNFKGEFWLSNGPQVFTDVMVEYCGVPVKNMTDCHNFTMLKYESLFAIQFFELEMYYNENRTQEAFERIEKKKDVIIGHHIGNNLSNEYNLTCKVGTEQAYGLLAQKYCPRAYWSLKDGDVF